jgi:hypothetical protein
MVWMCVCVCVCVCKRDRERNRERHRERDRETQRERERARQRYIHTERQRDRETERETAVFHILSSSYTAPSLISADWHPAILNIHVLIPVLTKSWAPLSPSLIKCAFSLLWSLMAHELCLWAPSYCLITNSVFIYTPPPICSSEEWSSQSWIVFVTPKLHSCCSL